MRRLEVDLSGFIAVFERLGRDAYPLIRSRTAASAHSR